MSLFFPYVKYSVSVLPYVSFPVPWDHYISSALSTEASCPQNFPGAVVCPVCYSLMTRRILHSSSAADMFLFRLVYPHPFVLLAPNSSSSRSPCAELSISEIHSTYGTVVVFDVRLLWENFYRVSQFMYLGRMIPQRHCQLIVNVIGCSFYAWYRIWRLNPHPFMLATSFPPLYWWFCTGKAIVRDDPT